MDIFIGDLPPGCTERKLRGALKPFLQSLNINCFYVSPVPSKSIAFLTVLDPRMGEIFLARHGGAAPPGFLGKSKHRIELDGKMLRFSPGKQAPQPLKLECLKKEEADFRRRLLANSKSPSKQVDARRARHLFEIASLENGLWDISGGNLRFHRGYNDIRTGRMVLGNRSLIVALTQFDQDGTTAQMRIPYMSIETMVTSNTQTPMVCLTLNRPPLIYWFNKEDDWLSHFAKLDLTRSGPTPKFEKSRKCGLHLSHEKVVGICGVYRIRFNSFSDVRDLDHALQNLNGGPEHFVMNTQTGSNLRNLASEYQTLVNKLEELTISHRIPYTVAFQLQRLVVNWYLTSSKVMSLLPGIEKLAEIHPESALSSAIRTTASTLDYLGPGVDLTPYSDKQLLMAISEQTEAYVFEGSPFQQVYLNSELALIHRVVITPCTMTLEGPELEQKNRVLRKYPGKTDHFMRVTFQDEDGQNIRYERNVSRDDLFKVRFPGVMENGINIAGRLHAFLGFSHSSLRSEQCWFMSAFYQEQGEGNIIFAGKVITDLGEFTTFRSPAKCAARIGQAFSDTTDAIPLHGVQISTISDIERNGRCFTDGVGTISREALRLVWDRFARTRRQKATVLQIRHAGAKGMVSLDSNLTGKQLNLRPSMIKFQGSRDRDLEICGAGYRSLPMHLNRDFIKILEDLGVRKQVFLDLQTDAVGVLQATAHHPINAAYFLEDHAVSNGSKLSSLIRSLYEMDIHFRDDDFLRQAVDISVLMQLRELKYRARIPVPEAHTLMGVADSTGKLGPGEVYISIRDAKGHLQSVSGTVVVTRSPARHPGDIQLARAVQVPMTSPLTYLHNTIVFSTQGERDLPSQLSGGDLDGDLFNVILDTRLFPTHTCPPADYHSPPPVDIGRSVQTKDIYQFFLTFMETDQLGHICNIHTQLADQHPSGTKHETCLHLAEMASTAVDYSKTGIPVDLQALPRFDRTVRPDFMADALNIVIDKTIQLEEVANDPDAPEDPASLLEPDAPRYRYYESPNALGHLYRAINEQTFMQKIQEGPYHQPSASQMPLLDRMWSIVSKGALAIQYTNYEPRARQAKARYEEALINIMYEYSADSRVPLDEMEVYSGCIQSRYGGATNMRTRQRAIDMKGAYERDVSAVVTFLLKDDDEMFLGEDASYYGSESDMQSSSKIERLARSIAGLSIALEEEGRALPKRGTLVSWKYVAAAICLQQFTHVFGRGWAFAGRHHTTRTY